MRLVVGSEESRDFRQAELDRHLEAMSIFIERAARQSTSSARCTMILRSPASTPARALVAAKDAAADAGVRVRVVVAKLAPHDDLKQLFACLSTLSPDVPAAELIRWARNPRLLEAHEQVTYGNAMSWTGDAMRRDADKRNPLVLFDMDTPDVARLGQLSFRALWDASTPVPEHQLAAGGAPKPSGAYEAPEPPVSPLRPPLQGWPLVRH